MSAKGVIPFIAIVVLLLPLAEAVAPDRDPQQPPLENLINLEDMMDDDTAELLWANCGAELIYSTETLQDLQSSGSDGKEQMLKALTIQDPLVKKTILDCIKDKRITLSKSGEDRETRKTKKEHVESSFPRRRRLAGGAGGGGTIVVAVVVTAIVTLVLAGVLFWWYLRTFGAAAIQNGESPLLNVGGSHKNGNAGDQSVDVNLNAEKMDSSLQLPPGRLNVAGIPPPGKAEQSSGKPPTGRVESSLRAIPGRVGSTLKPRTGRVGSTLRPTPGKVGSSLRTAAGRQASVLRSPPVNASHPPPPSVVAPPPLAAAPPPPAAALLIAPTSQPPPPPPPPGGAPPPPPPPRPNGPNSGPPPPPPPRGVAPPPRPPGGGFRGPRPPGLGDNAGDASKAKLKPFFWDKVNAKPGQQMVWSQIPGSFQFNEEMIESLFGYNSTEKNKNQNAKARQKDPPLIQIIDAKKAQNLSILLKALGVTTEEVCDALREGNELPLELVQTLIKMAPTGEEELKLRLYGGDISRLGSAERFLKALVEIPFAFKRLESLLFMSTLHEEEMSIKDSFKTLEAACVELKKSRLFLKLLEAVLKTGNRMNVGTFRGSAQAFKLDTLLKLSDVKGVDGKTTLLHFVVQEIIRSEGLRAVRNNKSFSSIKTEDVVEDLSSREQEDYYCKIGLRVVSGLSSELDNVKKAAIIDADGLTSSVSKLGHALVKARESLKEVKTEGHEEEEEDEFWLILSNFVQEAEKEIMWMLEEEKRIMALVKSTADYFHGKAGKDEGLRLFTVVRDFLIILEKVCKEIKNAPIRPPKSAKKIDGESPNSSKLQAESQKKDDQLTVGDSQPKTDKKDDDPEINTRKRDDDGPTSNDSETKTDKKHDELTSDDSQSKAQGNNDQLTEVGQKEEERSTNEDSRPNTERKDENLQPESQEKDDTKPLETQQPHAPDPWQRMFPAIAMRQIDSSSSDED